MSNDQPKAPTPTPATPPAEAEPHSIHKLEAQRRSNREQVAALGLNPYGTRADGITPIAATRARHDADADAEFNAKGKEPGYADRRPIVTIAGRVMLHRDNGKLIWINLRDDSGDMQVAVSQKDCAEMGFKLAKLTDLADVIIATGRLMKTRTGEVTVWASDLKPGAKSLLPPPEKHAGLSDVEIRYRQRYVDLWANPETLGVFKLRSAIVSSVRKTCEERGYLEVETPMLQALAGGAAARPFITKMNALDINLYMRIAPELYLKRLMVGGFPRVFEINRNFRNEGLDKQHNPEFTMLEAYCAWGNVETVMELTEAVIRNAATQVARESDHNPLGRPIFDGGQYAGLSLGYVAKSQPSYILNTLSYTPDKWQLPGDIAEVFRTLLVLKKHGVDPIHALREIRDANAKPKLRFGDHWIDYSRPFDRVSYSELFETAYGFGITDQTKAKAELKRRLPAQAAAIETADHWHIVNHLFEDKAEKSVDPTRPTFITDYPSAISPLTRPKPGRPELADRADLFIAGMELAPHYTELNDPDVQEAKFREQLKGLDAEKNAEENTFRTMDHDFVRALKVGMPPAGGMGLGIDRLVMLLTNQRTIRDVVLFPLMRPEETGTGH